MNQTTLGEALATFGGSIQTGPFGTVLKASQYSASGVPIISVGEIGYGALRLRADTPRASESLVRRLPSYVLRHGDIVFGRKGGVDRSAWVHAGEDGWFLGSDGIRVRFSKLIDSKFVSYQLRSDAARAWLIRHAAGSTMPSLNEGVISRFPLTLPNLPVQRAIAEVLGALDDKIAANATLLSTIPAYLGTKLETACLRGSEEVPLAQLVHFHNRQRIPLSAREREERPGCVPYYGASGQFGAVDEALFDERLVLVGEDGSVVTDEGSPVVQYIWGPSWVNNHAHVLTGVGISTELLYLTLRRGDIRAFVTGAVQPKVSMGNLKRLPIEIPDTSGRGALEEIVASQMAAHRQFTSESKTLVALRDVLLPELMSGRLRVKDVEAVAEEVL